MTAHEKGFLAAIRADEFDHLSRCAYADWLEENDRPEEADRQRRYVGARRWMLDFAKENHAYGKYHDWEQEERTGKDKYGHDVDAKRRAEEFYEQFMEYLKGHVGADKHGGFFGFDLPYDFADYSDEMWAHFEVLTGLKAPAEGDESRTAMPSNFRCAC